jgi:hypothetical protein
MSLQSQHCHVWKGQEHLMQGVPQTQILTFPQISQLQPLRQQVLQLEYPDNFIRTFHLGSQRSYPESSKERVRNVKKAEQARKDRKARKTGKAKSTGSLFFKRKSVAVSSRNGEDRSRKTPPPSKGPSRISGRLLPLNIKNVLFPHQFPQNRFRVCFFILI